MSAVDWIAACKADDIMAEDVTGFEHGGRQFAIYRSPGNEYFATDGLCTHEAFELFDGFVMDDVIECPKHNGRFDARTGEVTRKPALEALCMYPVRRVSGRLVSELEPQPTPVLQEQ